MLDELRRPGYADPADIMEINRNFDLFYENAERVDIDIEELNKNKADGGKAILFDPTLSTTNNNQDFNYTIRQGYYTIIGDKCFYDFSLIINNMPTSVATGNLVISMPLPVVRIGSSNTITYSLIATEQLSGLWLSSNGAMSLTTTEGASFAFNMGHINKPRSNPFQLMGQISYYWR